MKRSSAKASSDAAVEAHASLDLGDWCLVSRDTHGRHHLDGLFVVEAAVQNCACSRKELCSVLRG